MIVILGGGPAGLAAAWELTEAGHPVVVVEKGERLGGLCATNAYRGFRFDLGGHRFISGNRELVDRVRRLMGDDLLRMERRSVIAMGGPPLAAEPIGRPPRPLRFIDYPLSWRGLRGQLPPALLARAVSDYLVEAARGRIRRRPDVTFEDWVVHRFGRCLYELFFGAYTEKLWGIPPHELSADWAAQRISLLNLADVALRMMGMGGATPRTYARAYLYPRLGIGQIFERMAEVIAARGGQVMTGAVARHFVVRNGRARAVVVEQDGAQRELSCDAVISTMPLPELAVLLGGESPPLEAAACRLRYRGVRFLNLLLDMPDFSENTWIYVPHSGCRMTRIQEPKRRSPFMAPSGQTSLMLEIPSSPGDAVWGMSRDELLEMGLQELSILGFDVRERLIDAFVVSTPNAYPIYALGYQEPRDRLLRFVEQTENILTIGRQGLFRYIFTDTAMEMGLLAARWAVHGGGRQPIYDVDWQPGLKEIRSVIQ
jgi:protoporphyrinogen oxidase